MPSKGEAKAAVLAIAKRYGHIEDEVWNRMNPDDRRKVQETISALSSTAAHSIKT